ncbi:MAG TPA: STT3 domain-containing protein [Anaerolineales bacterium]|nr:STT3 domain-containing protein [Anaerolineales bacterium]
MRKVGWIAFFLSLAGVLAAALVADRVFERVPHVEDEMAYVWQAKVYARGQLTAPAPPDPGEMMVPFVVNYHGQRFAKYPPGWPMLLAFGVLLGLRDWVNPLLAGLAIWLTYRLGGKLFSRGVGLLAAFLILTSPLFLINSGSLDSHPWSLVLSLVFTLAWLDAFGLGKVEGKPIPAWLTAPIAGLSLGLLALTRPLTALAVGLPFFVHGLIRLFRGGPADRRRVLAIGLLGLATGLLFFAWQYGVTGSPFIDPYTLWWSFDRIGFGPGIGTAAGGHTLLLGLRNARDMLKAGARDLFGWKSYSWLFLPFGLWAMRRNRPAWLALGIFPALVGAYVFYWAEAVHYGPRYYYESLPILALVSAAGIFWLAGRIKTRPWNRINPALAALLTAALVGYNLQAFLPATLKTVYGLYGIHRSQLAPFQTGEAKTHTPALVFVHIEKTWTEYGGLLELEDPWLTSPFIFAWSNTPATDARLASQYPQRQVLQYYPDKPGQLFASP